MQRLVLVADEVAFMDRPGVTFGDFGLVGHASEARRFKLPDDSPVVLSVQEPPTWRDGKIYERYAEVDMRNSAFVNTFIQGITSDDNFAFKFLQPSGNYGFGTGREVRTAIARAAPNLSDELHGPVDGKQFFKCDTVEGCRETLKFLAYEVSAHVTSALTVAERTGLVPVSDDPYMARLLATRAASPEYVHSSPSAAAALGLAVAQSVLPDACLAELEIDDLLSYRKETAEAYHEWRVEMDRLATDLEGIEAADMEAAVRRIISRSVGPKLIEYRNEMRAVRDKLFGDLIKKVATIEMPTLSFAFVLGLGWTGALAAFVGGLAPAVPAVVDYVNGRRNVKRRNAMAYLIGAAPQASVDR